MKVKTAKQLMDSFYTAGRIRGMLPSLPKGVSPSYVHILDSVQSLSKDGKPVRASDISQKLNVAKPGITRALNEMEHQDLIQRLPSAEDGRVTEIRISEKGQDLLQTYSTDYFEDLVQDLGSISEEDASATIRTISLFYQAMLKRN